MCPGFPHVQQVSGALVEVEVDPGEEFDVSLLGTPFPFPEPLLPLSPFPEDFALFSLPFPFTLRKVGCRQPTKGADPPGQAQHRDNSPKHLTSVMSGWVGGKFKESFTGIVIYKEHKDGFGQDFHPRNPTPSPEHIKLSKAPFSGPEIESKSRSAQLKGK